MEKRVRSGSHPKGQHRSLVPRWCGSINCRKMRGRFVWRHGGICDHGKPLRANLNGARTSPVWKILAENPTPDVREGRSVPPNLARATANASQGRNGHSIPPLPISPTIRTNDSVRVGWIAGPSLWRPGLRTRRDRCAVCKTKRSDQPEDGTRGWSGRPTLPFWRWDCRSTCRRTIKHGGPPGTALPTSFSIGVHQCSSAVKSSIGSLNLAPFGLTRANPHFSRSSCCSLPRLMQTVLSVKSV